MIQSGKPAFWLLPTLPHVVWIFPTSRRNQLRLAMVAKINPPHCRTAAPVPREAISLVAPKKHNCCARFSRIESRYRNDYRPLRSHRAFAWVRSVVLQVSPVQVVTRSAKTVVVHCCTGKPSASSHAHQVQKARHTMVRSVVTGCSRGYV